MRIFKDKFYVFLSILYGACLLLLVVLSITVPKGDDVLFVNGNHSSRLDAFFFTITNLGNGIIFIPIILSLAFVRLGYAAAAACAWIGHGILCSFLKRVLFSGLQRPKSLIDNDLLHFVPNVEVHSHYSFPSGHTATIFCAAILLSIVSRHRLISTTCLLIALVVAYSRIYLLQHFLMDVAGGAAVGMITAVAFWALFMGNNNSKWKSMRIELHLQPSWKPARAEGSKAGN